MTTQAMLRCARYVIIALCVAVPSPWAQTVRSQTPVVTRLVQVYSDAERRLTDAINRKDTGEIDGLVANDFELRSANNIGVPVPRADWLAQSLKEAPASVSIGQMAVHDYGAIRIVSFLMKRTVAGDRDSSTAVIDVWMQSGELTILKVRYVAAQ
jgi:hypothetical protein